MYSIVVDMILGWIISITNGSLIYLPLLQQYSSFSEFQNWYASLPQMKRITGSIKVRKTWPRWVISSVFWILLNFYAAIYVAYFSVAMLWCILGAILSPEKFLPLASGAGVMIACIVYFYISLSKLNKHLTEVVGKIVDDQLKVSIVENINKNPTVNEIINQAENLKLNAFEKILNCYMKVRNLQSIDRDVWNEIMKGNGRALIHLINVNFGVDYTISLGLLGVLRNDPILALDCVYKLSEKLNLDPELNVSIMELIFCP